MKHPVPDWVKRHPGTLTLSP